MTTFALSYPQFDVKLDGTDYYKLFVSVYMMFDSLALSYIDGTPLPSTPP